MCTLNAGNLTTVRSTVQVRPLVDICQNDGARLPSKLTHSRTVPCDVEKAQGTGSIYRPFRVHLVQSFPRQLPGDSRCIHSAYQDISPTCNLKVDSYPYGKGQEGIAYICRKVKTPQHVPSHSRALRWTALALANPAVFQTLGLIS